MFLKFLKIFSDAVMINHNQNARIYPKIGYPGIILVGNSGLISGKKGLLGLTECLVRHGGVRNLDGVAKFLFESTRFPVNCV